MILVGRELELSPRRLGIVGRLRIIKVVLATTRGTSRPQQVSPQPSSSRASSPRLPVFRSVVVRRSQSCWRCEEAEQHDRGGACIGQINAKPIFPESEKYRNLEFKKSFVLDSARTSL